MLWGRLEEVDIVRNCLDPQLGACDSRSIYDACIESTLGFPSFEQHEPRRQASKLVLPGVKMAMRRSKTIELDRRSVSRLGMMSAFMAGATAVLADLTTAKAFASTSSQDQSSLPQEIKSQIRHEEAWAFFRSVYDSLDLADAQGFVSHFLQSDLFSFQDAAAGFNFAGYQQFAGAFGGLIGGLGSVLGPGRSSKLFHVTGDLRYGAVVEHVFPRNTFFSTNGLTIQTVIDMSGGFISRNLDYWDSRELGQADITGGASTSGVAVPFGAVHPGGVPLSLPPPAPPTGVALASGVDGRASASPAMVGFVREFTDALSHGSVGDVLGFFTEDALYVNPVIHQGPAFYGNFDQTIQIRGRRLLRSFLDAVLSLLPDGPASTLVHVVGSAAGGGFEWKAGGPYAATGLDRSGLAGSTALDLAGGRICRMSVKFDTFQMPTASYDQIRAELLAAGVVDQAF